MANLDAPLGFRAVENGVAGVVPRLREYSVKAATAVYEGDLVALNSTGEVQGYSATDALAGDLLGVAAHPVAAALADRSILVYDDPEQLYEVQADDASLTVVADYLFQLFAPVATAGNATTLQSKQELDASSGSGLFGTNVTNVRPIQVVGVSKAINNDESVSFTRYIAKIAHNAHIRGGGGASAIGGGIG